MEKNNIIKFPLPWFKRIPLTCIFITVTIFVITLIICTLTVHAEEVTTYKYSYTTTNRREYKDNTTTIQVKNFNFDSDCEIVGVAFDVNTWKNISFYCYVDGKLESKMINGASLVTTTTYADGTKKTESSTTNTSGIVYASGYSAESTATSYFSYTSTVKIFGSNDSALKYFQTGDESEQLNKPSVDVEIPEHKDSNFTLLGFKANKDITATWTGTTERTKLTEVTPYEYVHAYIGYAYKNAPGQIAKRVEYDEFFPMEDYVATIDWDSIQADDDTIFLRYVQFYPMYSDTEGFFGTFIYGNPSTIWFRNDGTIESVESNGIMNYDFSTDTIHTEIPLPEISNISHRGFTIENLGEYYVDVMVNTYLYGVKLIAPYGMGAVSATDYATKPDKTWIYDQEFYQPSLHSDIAINQTNIDIERDFGIDTITPMINAFKRWSITYPHVKQLPDYSWQMVGCQTQYNDTHVYKQDSQLTDFEQLVKSGQATTVFYVRFYNDNGQTGQWVKYTYSDGFGSLENGGITDGTIASGAVDVDSNGNVHINESNGYVDENGNISYPVYGTESGIGADVSLNGFKDTLEEFVSAVGNIPEYISKLFGFLPWWCPALIGLAIGAVVILRFLGR